MAIPKLPPPPRNPQSIGEVNDWAHRLYEFLGKSETNGLAKVNGKLTMRASSRPNPPDIAQETLSIPIGLQFAFNFNLLDTVDGYWIYKSATNDSTAASRYKFVPQSASQGIYTFQDNTGQGVSAYYWVTSINSVGESDKVPAGQTATSLTPSQTMTVYRPSVSSGSYTGPERAYDANLNIGAFGAVTGRGGQTETWSGFSAAVGSPSSVTLKVASFATAESDGGSVSLQYSVDGGANWTDIYNVDADRDNQTDSVTLLAGQDLTLVKVKGNVHSVNTLGDLITQGIYEIWIEVVV